jgi:predicted regulator of Ras-like GTPase activity (Roadblock/LC7/MglB family)
MPTSPDLALQGAARAAVDQVMREVRGATAAVVSTEDGFEVASRVENTAQIARLSALASSMAALGAIAGEENRLGTCTKVVIEATEGHIVMVQAQRADVSLVLSVVAGRGAIMGQLLYFAGEATRTLQAA